MKYRIFCNYYYTLIKSNWRFEQTIAFESDGSPLAHTEAMICFLHKINNHNCILNLNEIRQQKNK